MGFVSNCSSISSTKSSSFSRFCLSFFSLLVSLTLATTTTENAIEANSIEAPQRVTTNTRIPDQVEVLTILEMRLLESADNYTQLHVNCVLIRMKQMDFTNVDIKGTATKSRAEVIADFLYINKLSFDTLCKIEDQLLSISLLVEKIQTSRRWYRYTVWFFFVLNLFIVFSKYFCCKSSNKKFDF